MTPSMDHLIDEIKQNDPEITQLSLTSECESSDEVDRLLEALEENEYIESIIFRESFFPLRRIREHLTRTDFWRMLEGVSRHVSDFLVLPPTMMGMVRGQLAGRMLGPRMLRFYSDEAITFGRQDDVDHIVERLEGCTQLQVLQLGKCFFLRFQPPQMDALFQVSSFANSLVHLEISSHPNKSLQRPIASPKAIASLIESTSSTLEVLNLARIGLGDSHFQAIGESLGPHCSLQQLNLDGNQPSRLGLEGFIKSLRFNNPILSGLSIRDTWKGDQIANCLLSLFPGNTHLSILQHDCQEWQNEVLDFWLNLNGSGRSLWMSQSGMLPSGLWALVLERVGHDASSLLYVLQQFSDKLLIGAEHP